MPDHIDPVCGMRVEEQQAAGMSEREGTSYYFDSEECMSKFNEHPKRFAKEAEGCAYRHNVSDRTSLPKESYPATRLKFRLERR